MSGTQAEIMAVALDKYLGTEDQWCRGALARDKDGCGLRTSVHRDAVQHCAEGAIIAATYNVSRTRAGIPWSVPISVCAEPVLQGVEQVLVQQHPELVEAIKRSTPSEKFNDGRTLPMFNDGFMYSDDVGEGFLVVKTTPGVGYQGIRAAFEKYLAECQEKGL